MFVYVASQAACLFSRVKKNILDVAKRNENKNSKSHRREVKVIGVLFTAEFEEKNKTLLAVCFTSIGHQIICIKVQFQH